LTTGNPRTHQTYVAEQKGLYEWVLLLPLYKAHQGNALTKGDRLFSGRSHQHSTISFFSQRLNHADQNGHICQHLLPQYFINFQIKL
jgi:hypothetical protein